MEDFPVLERFAALDVTRFAEFADESVCNVCGGGVKMMT